MVSNTNEFIISDDTQRWKTKLRGYTPKHSCTGIIQIKYTFPKKKNGKIEKKKKTQMEKEKEQTQIQFIALSRLYFTLVRYPFVNIFI
jgi:hypothetical protein